MPTTVTQVRTPRAADELSFAATPYRFGIVAVADPAWINPLNVQSADSVVTTINPSGFSNTGDLNLLQFGHTIPDDAIIESVNVRVKGYKSPSGNSAGIAVQLQRGGSAYGTEATLQQLTDTQSDLVFSFPMRSQTTPLVVSDVNSSNFGVLVRARKTFGGTTTVSLDSVEIQVVYYDPQTGTTWQSAFDSTTVTNALANNDAANSLSAANTLYTKWPSGLTPGQFTNYLRLTDFNFSIPAGAVIVGITAKIAHLSNLTAYPVGLALVRNGIAASANRANALDIASSAPGPGAPVTTVGGATDTWGNLITWDAAAINDADFGIQVQYLIGNNAGANPVQVRVDQIQITVDYYVPVAVSGSLTGGFDLSTMDLKPKRGLSGGITGAASLSTVAATVKYALGANLPLLASLMATGLNGGIAYVDTGSIQCTRSRTESRGAVPDGGLWTNIDAFEAGATGSAKWTCGAGAHNSDPALIDSFGFGVPSNATIEPSTLVLKLRCSSTAGVNFIQRVRIRKADMVSTVEYNVGVLLDNNAGLSNVAIPLPLPNDFILNAADLNDPGFGIEFEIFSFAGNSTVAFTSAQLGFTYHLPAAFKMQGTTISGALEIKHRLPVVNQFDGPKLSSQQQNEVFTGGVTWANLSQVALRDGQLLTTSGPLNANQATNRLNVSVFGFSVPAIGELTKLSITVAVQSSHSAGAGTLCDREVYLMKQGNRVGTNKAVAGLTDPVGANGAIGKSEITFRTYVWTAAELAAAGITRALVISGTPLDFGFSYQLATKSSASVTPTASLDYIEATIEWTTLSGTLTLTGTVGSPAISNPVSLGVASMALSGALQGTLGARYAATGALTGQFAASAAVLGIPFRLTASLSGALSIAPPTMRLGVDHHFFGTVNGAVNLSSPRLICDYRLNAGLTLAGFLGTPAIAVVTTATDSSFRQRVLDTIPPWFGDDHPVLDAVVDGLVNAWLHCFQLIRYAGFQTRLRTMTDGWIDLAAADFFGGKFPRKKGELDGPYRDRFIAEIFRIRSTREAIAKALYDLTGRNDHVLIEPQRPLDTGVYGTIFVDPDLSAQIDSGSLSFVSAAAVTLLTGDVSTNSWSNIGNVIVPDSSSATCTLNANGFSQLLRVQGLPVLDPALLDAARIVSVRVTINVSATASSVQLKVQPVKSSVIQPVFVTTPTLASSMTEIEIDLTSVFTIDDLRHPNTGVMVQAVNITGSGSKTVTLESITVQVIYQHPDQYRVYGLGYNEAGIYGSTEMDYQGFVNVKLPKRAGIALVGGYGVSVFGYSIPSRGVWARSADAAGTITDKDIYEAIDRVAPVGTTTWVNISV